MADIGATLRETRMRSKIDINEVERATKIRAKYLRAIENEEWDLLPGEVYVKSFLRTYGDYLGVDSRQLIDEYKRRYERPSDHETRPISARTRDRDRDRERHRRSGPLIPPWLVIGCVLVAVVVALYFVGRSKSPSSSTTPSTQAGVTHHRKHHSTSAATTTEPKTKPKPTMVTLQLVPTAEVYVCLEDGSGKQLIPGVIYNVGDTIPTKRSSKLMLTLGNASVKMKVNGVTVPVTPSSGAIGLLLTPTTHSTLPAGKQPTCA